MAKERVITINCNKVLIRLHLLKFIQIYTAVNCGQIKKPGCTPGFLKYLILFSLTITAGAEGESSLPEFHHNIKNRYSKLAQPTRHLLDIFKCQAHSPNLSACLLLFIRVNIYKSGRLFGQGYSLDRILLPESYLNSIYFQLQCQDSSSVGAWG